MPTLLRDRGPVLGCLRPQYGGRGTNLLGETLPEGPLTQLKCGTGGGVHGDPSEGTARGGTRKPDRYPTSRINPVYIGYYYLGEQVTSYAQWEGAQGGPKARTP